MKNKASVLLLLSTSLLVSACTNPTLSNSASSPVSEGSSSSSKGVLSSSSSSSSSASSSDLLTAEEAWKRAFALDYSNATSSYAESIHTAGEGNSDENIVTEYNFNGYNVIYDTESTSASNAYLYYHDYENKNYLYFADDGHGAGWLEKGYHDVPLAVDNTYFDLKTAIAAFKNLDYKNVRYGLEDKPLFFVTDETAIASLAQAAYHFNSLGTPFVENIAYFAIAISNDCVLSSITAFDSYGQYYSSSTAAVQAIGTTVNPVADKLPAAPTAETVKTYAEWSGTEPWVETHVTSLTLETAVAGASLELEQEATLELKGSFLPEKANTMLLEAQSSDESKVTVTPSATSGNYTVTGLHEGEADIRLSDSLSKVVSKAVHIKVKGLKTSAQTGLVNQIRFDKMASDGTFTCLEQVKGASAISAKALDVASTSIAYPSTSGTNHYLYDDEKAVTLETGTAWDHNDAGLIFANDGAWKGISFYYGLVFDSHKANLDTVTAQIFVSDDLTSWTLEKDWTAEFKATVSGLNPKLFDLAFATPHKDVKVEFDSNFVGKNVMIATQEINFYR
jgi:hypothetical protein